MGTSILQADSSQLVLQQPRKKRSFSLPSFGIGRSSGHGEGQGEQRSDHAEEAVRVQKAAAWQWYTRAGVGEAVVRPPLVAGHLPPTHDSKSMTASYNSTVLHKKPLQLPPRAASRFKAEARPTTPSAPSPAAPSTPLYDEFELSGLRTHMADFVQRLQHQPIKDIAVADLQKSKPRPNFPAPTSVATGHQRTKAPPPVAASDQAKLTKFPPPASTPFRMRPFSALHRLFRKVVPGSFFKSTKNPRNSSLAVYEPEVLPEEGDDNTRYHYHHYIHHHHHHYHYDQSPEESIATIPRRRRRSESSGISPRTPSLWEAESDEEERGVEESPIYAYFSRRRRYSESFTGQLPPKKAAFDEDEESVLSLQFPKRYESERFSPNKIPSMDYAQSAPAGGKDEFYEELADMKSRRRNSAENYREEASLERKAVEGGGKSEGGTYKLGGGATQAKPMVRRRRHSETSQRPEAVQMGERPYWQSPSARYYVDVPANANANANANPNPAVLPPPSSPLTIIWYLSGHLYIVWTLEPLWCKEAHDSLSI